MKKYIVLIISFLALGFSVMAQNAESFLKSAVDKLKSYDNIAISFDYDMINTDAGINESMEGSACMQGNAYRLNILGQEIICDGTTTWTYNADAEEVMISEVDNENGKGTPLAVMNSYYDDINAKFTDDGKTDIRKIEAKPKSADDNLNKLLITLNVKTLEIKDIHIFDNNGNEFVYIIKTFVTNQELPADYFTFKESAYPDAEVIDMR